MQNLLKMAMRLLVKARFKVFRLFSLILLGREGGRAIVGSSVLFDLEFTNTKIVRDRILDRKLLSEAYLQTYDCAQVPECWRSMFSRSTAFPRRFAYVLKDVEIGAESGVMHIRPSGWLSSDDGTIFIQSAGSINFLFSCGIQEVMCRARPIDEDVPICPMPVIGYYHDVYEGILRVVKAMKAFGDIRVLVPKRRPRYIDEMLELVGVEAGQVIVTDYPVLAKRGVLIPRWIDSGENLKSDVEELRQLLVSRLPDGLPQGEKLYISRAKSRRPLANEREIERLFLDNGFKVAYFEDIPLIEQLKAIRSAGIVVTPHGAALSNIVVARPLTRVVEIMTQNYANSCYGHLASSLGLNYTCIDADDVGFIARIEKLFADGCAM